MDEVTAIDTLRRPAAAQVCGSPGSLKIYRSDFRSRLFGDQIADLVLVQTGKD
jgi:hypothetical protein